MAKKHFKELSVYIGLFDGVGKLKLNWQEMYQLFPNYTFEPDSNFGQYVNFGQAFEHKDLSMIVTDKDGHQCKLVYKEYGDNNENLAYVMEF